MSKTRTIVTKLRFSRRAVSVLCAEKCGAYVQGLFLQVVSAVCARVFNLVIMTSCFYDSDCDFAFILIFDNYYFLCFGHSNYYNYSGYYSFLYEK